MECTRWTGITSSNEPLRFCSGFFSDVVSNCYPYVICMCSLWPSPPSSHCLSPHSHPSLTLPLQIAWMLNHAKSHPEKAEAVQRFLSVAGKFSHFFGKFTTTLIITTISTTMVFRATKYAREEEENMVLLQQIAQTTDFSKLPKNSRWHPQKISIVQTQRHATQAQTGHAST